MSDFISENIYTHTAAGEHSNPIQDARNEGLRQARIQLYKAQYQEKARYFPESGVMDSKYYEDQALIENHKNSGKLSRSHFAVTINFGHITDHQEFVKKFTPIHYQLQKSKIIKDYNFILEAADNTGRLHLHGYIEQQERKGKPMYDKHDIKQQIFVRTKKVLKDPNHNSSHIYVSPLWYKPGWDQYVVKTWKQKNVKKISLTYTGGWFIIDEQGNQTNDHVEEFTKEELE